MAKVKQVVLVGHCGFDSGSLHHAVERVSGGAQVKAINSRTQLDAVLQEDAQPLLLINRVLDGSFDADSGIELVEELAQRDPAPVLMLISNYEDAQADAVQAGALPGFGKGGLNSATFEQRMRAALDGEPAERAGNK